MIRTLNTLLGKEKIFLFVHLVIAFFALSGWQLCEAIAEDDFEPDNSPTEANSIILNELVESKKHTLHNESDEDWFVYYWTVDPNYDRNPDDDIPGGLFDENHTVLIYDSADESIANERVDMIWEVFDRSGNKLVSGVSGDRFGPKNVPPPLGPLGSDIYFLKLKRDPAIPFASEITYYLKLQGTGIPKVRGFITDADTNRSLAEVTITTNLPNPVPAKSFSNGFYMLHVRESNITLTYELDGYETHTENVNTVIDDNQQIDIEMTPISPVDDFVTRFYRLILGREPDPAGLNGWVDDLQNGNKTACDIAFGFVFSLEFIDRATSDDEFVAIMYHAFFDRDPDVAGFNGWLDVLQSGGLRKDVLEGFLFSQEFSDLADSFGITACKVTPGPRDLVEEFVVRFYRLILDREPDPAGKDGWVNDLLNGIRTGSDIAHGFIFSPEFINRMTSNPEYLTILYRAFFDREPDGGGFNTWLDELESGTTRETVLNGFLRSQEFVALAEEFDITPF
jgi:hypothetical protein